MITKLVMHYEYFARNEARYEARNASVQAAAVKRHKKERAKMEPGLLERIRCEARVKN